MLAEPELMHLRQTLEGERQRLLKTLNAQVAPQLWEENPDDEDLADLLVEQELKLSMGQFNNKVLEQINRALDRLSTGTYGMCTGCAKEIPSERLEALPYAELCVGCQSGFEKRRGGVM
jgi:DnaK suppressor protein